MSGIKDRQRLARHNVVLANAVHDLGITYGLRLMTQDEVDRTFADWPSDLRKYAIDRAMMDDAGAVAVVDAKQVDSNTLNFTVSLWVLEVWRALQDEYGYDVWVCLEGGNLALASEVMELGTEKYSAKNDERFWLCSSRPFVRRWQA